MSFTPRPNGDDLGDEAVGGATEMVGAATVMLPPTEDQIAELVGATDTISGVTTTGSVALTELGGVTPTERKTRPAPPRTKTRTPVTPGPALDNDTFVKQGHPSDDDTQPNALLEDTNPRGRSVRDDPTRPRSAPEPSAKKTLGGYRVTGVLASGQMGVVYRGERPTGRGSAVAIKSVQSKLSSNPAVVARFFAESIVLARIEHPNVVRFHDFGYDAQGSAFLVMELLDGETLTKRLAREKRLDIPSATDIALQMMQGLAAAHKQGVIHRDIKPDNVFICTDGTVKLLDFGVAKLDGQGPTHTLQGDLLGTAAYMAPEQGRSASESDARSDIYSVGCVLFEMVSGVVPYPGSLVETLVAHQTAERPPARALNPEVSTELDSIIDRLLARDPAARPQTAAEVIKALTALESTTERPIRRPPQRRRIDVARGDARTLVGSPRWVELRSRFDSIKQRFIDEPIALGLLVVVIVLVLVLITRH